MKKQAKFLPPLAEELKAKIVERWRHYPLNSIPQLAAEFGCTKSQVHKCINDYLTKKIPS